MPDASALLAGVRIIDLTSNMSGPLATMVLADQGADVVKVEPPTGDAIRAIGSGHAGMSAYFANNNRGKRSIAVDLATGAGRDIVRRLTADADVFVQNFRPGVIDRLGLDPESLMAANDRLIYASISGFGTTGPLAGVPAYDHVVQALSGFAAIQSAGTSEPSMVRHGVIDKATAYTLAQAVTAALFQRERSGHGTRIDVSMLDVAIAFLWPDGMMDHTVDEPSSVLPPTSRSFRVTPTADGQVVLVTLTGAQWAGLTTALLDDEESDAMSDTAERMKGGADVMRRVRTVIGGMTTEDVVARLQAADVPVAPVLQLDEIPNDPQVIASGIVRAFHHEVLGNVHQPRPAPLFDGAPIDPSPMAPRLGQHTDDVLQEAGWSATAVATLRADGIVV
jgi:crotonobetainyl-CoA:carnitine CoA-transferase CaiB-like acyl-CoA transferase